MRLFDSKTPHRVSVNYIQENIISCLKDCLEKVQKLRSLQGKSSSASIQSKDALVKAESALVTCQGIVSDVISQQNPENTAESLSP